MAVCTIFVSLLSYILYISNIEHCGFVVVMRPPASFSIAPSSRQHAQLPVPLEPSAYAIYEDLYVQVRCAAFVDHPCTYGLYLCALRSYA